MRIAFMADIHANREALEACLAHAQDQHADCLFFLGDYVNYGADPEWVVQALMEHVEKGGIALRGNHDAAIGEWGGSMDPPAEVALEWTRNQLGTAHRAFLAGLPLTHVEDGFLCVHADAAAPSDWSYVTDAEDAARSLRATTERLTLCGHVHKPALYNVPDAPGAARASKTTAFRPAAGIPVPLLPRRRWLAIVGSVGQPRDGNPSAAYALLDTARAEITTFRVAYDIDAAAEKIRAAGLPAMLAERLRWGL
ncbi:MAG: metallophosphatase family protein [Thermoanaerobaculia bacterium]|nr:metallophosphatase family protein [Thermoanaerobaculia bacterium]